MTLAAGVRLGPYEIEAPVGAGGMGEVYRARDTRLDRDVAIKILPETFALDADRVARFEREAKTLAALNHPHIAQIHGVEESGGARALVMELVEGENLAERLQRGRMPVDEALAAARQIADALEAAHDKGILHRDLKPANVKMTPEGVIKILDFGLAKALAPEGPNATPDVMNSPTFTSPATQVGTILGTAAYMAPEQAKGKAVDKRADIWAFGVVLYEMLTGRRAFDAETVSEVVAAILTREPDWRALPAGTPPAVRRLLARCLDRDPRRRLRDIGEARVILDNPAAPTERVDSERSRRVLWPWLAAAILTAAGAAWVGYVAGSRPTAPREAQQLAIQLPAQQEIATTGRGVLTFSPDGGTLVFAARENGRQYLFRRSLSDRKVTAIPGTDDGFNPIFSPDGRWIGFRARRQLMKMPAEGGRPLPIARCSLGAVWLNDDTIVYNREYMEGLFRVRADGTMSEQLTTPNHAGGELGHWWPDVVPGGRFVIFTAYRTPIDRSRIGVLDLQARKIVRWLVDGGYFARYAPTGHVLYVKGGRLFALPFDPANATPTGAAVVVLDDVFTDQDAGFAAYAVSPRSALAYVTGALGNPPRELVWLDREGHRAPATSERRAYGSVSLSPDGRRAAVTLSEESLDLWTLSERGTLSRLTTADFAEFDPRWSRDAGELFYVVSSPIRPTYVLFRMVAGKTDSGRPIWDDWAGVDTFGIAVSPDGRTIAFDRQPPETGFDIYTRPLDGSEPARPFRATHAEEQYASFSPDGRWIAYESDETGRPEIYVDPLAGGGDHTQISSDGGTEPIWAQTGEIFYRVGEEMRAVVTRTTKGFEFDGPRGLFKTRIVPADGTARTFDVTPDGKRILAVTIPEESRPREIDVVLDWAALLARHGR